MFCPDSVRAGSTPRAPWLSLYMLLLSLGALQAQNLEPEWVIRLPGGVHVAKVVAEELGYRFLRQVRGFPDTYVLREHAPPELSKRDGILPPSPLPLQQDQRVEWAEQQKWRRRQKRDTSESTATASAAPKRSWWQAKRRARPGRADLSVPVQKISNLFNDELWSQQWYLQDTRTGPNLPQLDLRVVPVFMRGVTGKGVRITVLDDGLEHRHQDISPNYDPEISFDLNDGDPDPTPRYSGSSLNSHGTRCAGEIAMAANNRKCGVGVAYNARIGGIRMLDGEDNGAMDRIEGEALSFARDKVDIYSASWGPTDDGATVEGPGRLALEALERGVMEGRDGKGAIFVWAAGNGGSKGDDCNCDGYTSSMFTLSIGSASERGEFPWYGERCASTLACAYSSGAYSDQMIATTDLHNMCTVKHTGTSAAAPLAAGIVALTLEVNPQLTWRDVQHIVVWTSEVAPLTDNLGWNTNGAGFHINSRFGFGLMNALGMTEAAANWTLVPSWQHCRVPAQGANVTLVTGASPATLTFLASNCDVTSKKYGGPVRFIEHVEVKASIAYPVRGVLEIFLTSPSGTRVQLLNTRPQDTSEDGFNSWSFMSVHTWGEIALGTWVLEIIDTSGSTELRGLVTGCTLLLHGTSTLPAHMKAGPRSYANGGRDAVLEAKMDEIVALLETARELENSKVVDQQPLQEKRDTWWGRRWLREALARVPSL